MARNHKAGGQGEPHAARMGELLPSRHRQQGVSGTRQLHSDAVAPVVAVQAQNQAAQGRDLSTLASLRALWARTRPQRNAMSAASRSIAAADILERPGVQSVGARLISPDGGWRSMQPLRNRPRYEGEQSWS